MNKKLKKLKRKIRKLQRQLVRLVEKKGSFSDEEVVQLSQRLDRYILMAQKSSCYKLKVCG
ncbi:aspartyl-phosphate phosphatase Spo0E family protein [Paenibacillus ehimensis]|uniref:Aspartyl-phosphate phosphatase Spo0E family protein n=1 Tax=Paenibacillus ehimensis TaxID=79264 RepID=A0ABT8VM08_9BACL|nr:aspartyl-phosphate phosphatase Spo0E family protein [Paenibacillus ehimensis]MDO3682012.1 aspartyl-phosphate phosphatase Spo0E family protein [Paenibacillus ehimensis]